MKQSSRMYELDSMAFHSRLHDWNPVLKTVTVLILLCFSIWASKPALSLWLIITGGIITIRSARITGKEYGMLLGIPLAFLIPGVISIAMQIETDGGLYLYVTRESVWLAFCVAMRTMGAVSMLYLLMLSTSSYEVIGVLQKAHVSGVIIQLMFLTYRFIFILLEVQQRMYHAASSRLGYCDFKTSCRTFGGLAGNLLVQSMKKADYFYDAMEARGYDGTLCFLQERKRVNITQVLLATGYLATAAAVYGLC